MSSGNPVPPRPNQPPQNNGVPPVPPPPPQAPGQPVGSPTDPGYMASVQQPEPKQKSKRGLFIGLGATALILALLLGGIIAVNMVNNREHSAQATAQKYVDALNSGDMAAAEEIAPRNAPEQADTTLLDPKYVAASADKISDITITNTEVDGNSAVVNASYQLGGENRTMTFNATREGKKNMFFDNWVIQAPQLSTANISLPGAEGTTVNGEDFQVAGGTAEYALYPGTYEIVNPESKYIGESKETITVGYAEPGNSVAPEVALKGDITDTYTKEVEDAVKKHIDTCAKNAKFSAKGCPFSIDKESKSNGIKVGDDVVEKSIKYTIEKQPKIRSSYDADYGVGAFTTSAPGKVSWKADSKELGKGKWSGDGTFAVSGKVTIDGDRLNVDFF